jgi:hypothetical protein
MRLFLAQERGESGQSPASAGGGVRGSGRRRPPARFHYPQFRLDFGFGVDPGRLRGYPLAHLAGTWW